MGFHERIHVSSFPVPRSSLTPAGVLDGGAGPGGGSTLLILGIRVSLHCEAGAWAASQAVGLVGS